MVAKYPKWAKNGEYADDFCGASEKKELLWQYFVELFEWSAVVTRLEKADGSYWCSLGARWKGQVGPIAASKYSQNIHHLFHAAISDFMFWIFIHLSSVDDHLPHLDIYSLDIRADVLLFTQCTMCIYSARLEYQHLSLLPLSGCGVRRIKCPSAVIWHVVFFFVCHCLCLCHSHCLCHCLCLCRSRCLCHCLCICRSHCL